MSINIKPSHEGRLHEATHTPVGQKIPESKIEKAEHSENPAIRKEAGFAEAARHWHHHEGARKEWNK